MNNYWGLQSTPFRDAAGFGFFTSAATDEALARMQFLVSGNHRLGILVGQSGIGKSTCLARFASYIRSGNVRVAQLNAMGVDASEFIQVLATEFHVADRSSLASMWQGIFDHVLVNDLQQITTVITVDDLDEAEGEVLTTIARLAQGVNPTQRLTILASANSDRSHLIGPRLADIASLRIELWPWTQEESSAFILEELKRAGCQRAAFDVRALDRIHEIADGLPRSIIRLAELGLTAAAGSELELVDMETIDFVADELQLAVS